MTHWWLVSISCCNGLVPSGNKLLPEPVLTKFSIRPQLINSLAPGNDLTMQGSKALADISLTLLALINSLPSDVIWCQGYRSTLAQVMACCMTAPSHYLNQCWLMVCEVLWHSLDSNFTENTSVVYHWNGFETYQFETVVKAPRGQWVKKGQQLNQVHQLLGFIYWRKDSCDLWDYLSPR